MFSMRGATAGMNVTAGLTRYEGCRTLAGAQGGLTDILTIVGLPLLLNY